MSVTAKTAPAFIGPWQTPLKAPPGLQLGSYYLSSPEAVFEKHLTLREMAELPFECLPYAARSRSSVRNTHLRQLQRAVQEMSAGRWQSVYVPNKPGHGNNSGNGMSGIFFQRADLEVSIKRDNKGFVQTDYHWPKITEYRSRRYIQVQNFNYSLVFHRYRKAFESAFNLFIDSVTKVDGRLLESILQFQRIGLYCGITDYYGDPDLLPAHLRKQALQANPNPVEFDNNDYLDLLRQYREFPILPGNYHTDGIEKNLDIQGIFTVLHNGIKGGHTLVRRRGIRRHPLKVKPRQGEFDVTVKLDCPEGHAALWVPSWGRTEVEHTPGPLQGGHRTILVLGLDSSDFFVDYRERRHRHFYGSQYETLSWDRRSWHPGGVKIRTPDARIWHES